jgi:hypothetical protein
MERFHRLLQEFFPNSSSSMLSMDSDGNDVSISGEDDIAQDLVPLPVPFCADVNPEGFRIKPVEVDESGPIIRRFGKGLTFDLKNGIQIGEREGPNH